MKKFTYPIICFLLAVTSFVAPSCDSDKVDNEPATIKIDPVSLPVFGPLSGQETITVTVEPSGNEWSCANNDTWITLTDSGNKLTIKVDENNGSYRSGIVTISAPDADDVTVTVNQMQKGDSFFTVDSENLSFTHEGGEEIVRVSSSGVWEAETEDIWLEILPEQGQFTVRAEPYVEIDQPRYGMITVSAEDSDVVYEIKVTQTEVGFVAEISIADSDKELVFDAEGGKRTVAVTANVDWWANDKNRYEWLSIDKGTGEFTVELEPYGEFSGPRETEIILEADGIEEPIVIKVIQNQGTPVLSVDIISLEAEYNSTILKFNVESNTEWEISWGTENFYCPDGHPNGGWWGDFEPNKGKGSLEVSFKFSDFRPLTSSESRTGVIIISAEGVEDVKIPFIQTGVHVVDIPLSNIEQLLGEWEVTNEIILIGDQVYRNDHTITINYSDYWDDAIRISNITNINSYRDIGGASIKGDELDFYIDFDKSSFTLCSSRSKREDSSIMEPEWYPGSGATRTLVVAAIQESMYDTFLDGKPFPYIDIRLRSDGRHEINFTLPDYFIEYEGDRYYGSLQVGGYMNPRINVYATIFGGKWTKKVN